MPDERVRVIEHKRRHNFSAELPWRPATDGWRRVFAAREIQLRRLTHDVQQRWDGWTDLMQAGVLTPNFTSTGFKVVRAPVALHQKLHASLMQGLPNAPKELLSSFDNKLLHPRPSFVHQENLNNEVLTSLKPLHEEWSGVLLQPVKAYGLRVYRNGSTLQMHHDKVNDHIVSSILHVGHSGEPWPIVIESFDGSTHEVDLQPGEMLFYESAKCLHGRPRTFHGEYYSSLFIHYKPVGWGEKDGVTTDDVVYAVPDGWNVNDERAPAATLASLGVSSDSLPALHLASTAFYEPGCADDWCALATSVKHSGSTLEVSGGAAQPTTQHEKDTDAHEAHDDHEGHAGEEAHHAAHMPHDAKQPDASPTAASSVSGPGASGGDGAGTALLKAYSPQSVAHTRRSNFGARHEVAAHASDYTRSATAEGEGTLLYAALLGGLALAGCVLVGCRRRKRRRALVGSASKAL